MRDKFDIKTPEETKAIDPKKVQSMKDLSQEIEKKLTGISRESIIEQLAETAKQNGHNFGSDEEAKKWAEKKLDKALEKHRLKYGFPVCCEVCGGSVSNKVTGPLIRTDSGYKHRNC